MAVPRGTCPECGMVYYGWALLQPGHQQCQVCGATLNIEIPGHRDRLPVHGRKGRRHGEGA